MSLNTATPDTVKVLLPLPLADAYDYLPFQGSELSAGSIVSVPFGARQLVGVVWGKGDGTLPKAKLKTITALVDLPSLPGTCRTFIAWVAAYTVTPPGAILKMIFGSMRLLAPKKNDVFSLPQPAPDRARLAR
jgi:primosomal protein N' (replication factor Y)